MSFSLDVIALGVPEVAAAQVFYVSTFSPTVADHPDGVYLDLQGTGQLALQPLDTLAADAGRGSATSGFRGHVLSTVVAQPNEVEVLLDAASRAGATVLKAAKKSLFGGFSAVCQAPDGTIWKLSAEAKRNTRPAGEPPRPIETAAYLGVASPERSRAFYTALGMTVDRDYGDKWIDFVASPGASRLGLMPREALAKDAGADADGAGFQAATFHHHVASSEEVDAILAAASAAGGQVDWPASEAEGSGAYAGVLADPDGFRWKVVSA